MAKRRRLDQRRRTHDPFLENRLLGGKYAASRANEQRSARAGGGVVCLCAAVFVFALVTVGGRGRDKLRNLSCGFVLEKKTSQTS